MEYAVTFNARVEDAHAEPANVVVDGGEIVDVEDQLDLLGSIISFRN